MKTAMQELLSIIPDASEIKGFISENDADEKMLDEWLWERLYKDKDWIKKEKQQIIDAFLNGDDAVFHFCKSEDWASANDYYNETYKQ